MPTDDNVMSPDSGEGTVVINPPEASEGTTVDENLNQPSENGHVEDAVPNDSKGTGTQEESDEQKSIREKSKWSQLEAENNRMKQELESIKTSPALFKDEVDRLNSDPQAMASKEQEWINNPQSYETFRQRHLEVFGKDMGPIEQYFQTNQNSDPRVIEQISKKKIASIVDETIAERTAEQELENNLYAAYPDADPKKATSIEEREDKLNRLSIAKMWANDRVKYGLSSDYHEALRVSYAALEAGDKKAEEAAKKITEANSRLAKVNSNVGIGTSIGSSQAPQSSAPTYIMTDAERSHYEKILNGNPHAGVRPDPERAKAFAELCDQDNKARR